VMNIWDWIFIFYCAAAIGVGAICWYRWARPTKFSKEFVCDGCGQVCTHLKDGLCVYCDKAFKPTSQKPLP
jgi:hypothetical protein